MKKNDKNEQFYYQVKFIIVGDIFVGKTKIYYRYVNGDFDNKYKPTIMFDFLYQNIKINDSNFVLQLWDTAGCEEYKSITRTYFNNCACCIFVYDITKEETFKSIRDWIEEVNSNNTNKDIIFILVGNKYDLQEERKITQEQANAIANEYNMEFFETSALNGYNIDEIFNRACEKIYENINNNIYDLDGEEETCGIKKCFNKIDQEFNASSKQIKFSLKKNKNSVHKKKKKKC